MSSTNRNLSLAHAAIEHALYFLELDAPERAARYFTYASDRFREIALSMTDSPSSPPSNHCNHSPIHYPCCKTRKFVA